MVFQALKPFAMAYRLRFTTLPISFGKTWTTSHCRIGLSSLLRQHSTFQGHQPPPDCQHESGYKRLVVCCDGTWQASDRPSAKQGNNISSNVTKFCRALVKAANRADGRGEVQQVVFYQSGVGTDTLTRWSETVAGVLGYGVAENVVEAYNFLSLNYEEGDEICLFGFSRGAYTARSLAGLVSDVGIVDKRFMHYFPHLYEVYQEHGKPGVEEFLKKIRINIRLDERRTPIKVMGCWDTVGSLGIPDTWITSIPLLSKWKKGRKGLHNPNLSDNIENAFHALALDERRRPFSPTLWHLLENSKTNLVQCWFPGYHINIGGGRRNGLLDKPEGDLEQLADITFAWMVDLCSPFLAFDKNFIHQIHPDYDRLDQLEPASSNISRWAAGKFTKPCLAVQILSGSRTRTPGQFNPAPLDRSEQKYVANALTNEYMHASVRIRLQTLGCHDWDIKSTALRDFDLVEDVDVKDQRRSGWKWVKKLANGDTVEIPEMRVKRESEGDSAELLLMDQDTLRKVNGETKRAVKLVVNE